MAQVLYEEGQPMPVVPPVRGWRWRDVKPCGTTAAKRRHVRRGEPVDRSCRQAEARYAQDYRARRKANGGKPLGGRWPEKHPEPVAELQ